MRGILRVLIFEIETVVTCSGLVAVATMENLGAETALLLGVKHPSQPHPDDGLAVFPSAMTRRHLLRARGTTLVECIMATAVLGLGLAGVRAFNSQQLRTVRSTHEVSAAKLSMLERVEQMRIGSWK